eukprot:6486248-Amphidinium_carterae.1
MSLLSHFGNSDLPFGAHVQTLAGNHGLLNIIWRTRTQTNVHTIQRLRSEDLPTVIQQVSIQRKGLNKWGGGFFEQEKA